MTKLNLARAGTLVAMLLGTSLPAAAQDITFGAILPLTGPGAVVGLAEQQGIQAAVAKINASGGIRGRTLRVVYDDSQGKADLGVLAFNKQTTLDDVPAIIGAYSGPTIAMAPLATRRKILLMNPAAQSNKLAEASPYLFNTIPLNHDEVAKVAQFAIGDLGAGTAAVIYENSAAGIDSLEDFRATFEELGGTVSAVEPVQFGDTNFRPALIKVADRDPDVVFVTLTQGHTSFADQVGQLTAFPPVIGTTYITPMMGHPASNGWYNTAIRGTFPEDVQAYFLAEFGIETPNVYSREYYGATMILAEITGDLIDAGASLTGAALRDALLAKNEFDYVAPLSFEGSLVERDIDILTVRDGEIEILGSED